MEMVSKWEAQESLSGSHIAAGGNHWGGVLGFCVYGLSENPAGHYGFGQGTWSGGFDCGGAPLWGEIVLSEQDALISRGTVQP